MNTIKFRGLAFSTFTAGLALSLFVGLNSGNSVYAQSVADQAQQQTVDADKLSAKERARLQTIAKRVTIIRDDFGVPHIYGNTDADAVFGMLFAQAEDDFARVERNYVWAMGRLAEVEGKRALVSDLRARLYMTIGEAKSALAGAPQSVKDLCQACLLYTSPSPRDATLSRMPSSA